MNSVRSILALILICNLPAPAFAQDSIAQWITGNHRSAANTERNGYRHPVETLQFFGIQPDSAVLEVWPGGGWYTEILAPYLKESGHYTAAHFSSKQDVPFFQNTRKTYLQKLGNRPDLYQNVVISSLYPPAGDITPAADSSQDFVLTFRNVHNWSKGGFDQAMFNVFYKVLKPGGILGVVEHRAKPGTDFDTMIKSGYMTEDYVVGLAKNAGFELLARSEINANPKDTTSHPNGVWSLPPTLRGGDTDQATFLGIGESDRMTLKFVKAEK